MAEANRGGRARPFAVRVSLPLTAVLALIVTACGGGGGGGGAPAGATPTGPIPTLGESPAATSPAASPAATSPAASPAATSPAASPAATSPAATGGAALSPPAANVQLDYWNPFTAADGKVMAALVDRFNSETPTCQVTNTTQAEYYTQINNAAAAGNLPDVMIMHLDQVAINAANDVISPVDDLVQQLGLGAEQFTEAVWNGTQWKGTQFSIPLDIHPATLYWNKALFRKAGLDPENPPANREEFENALTKLKEAGVTGPVWSNHFFSAGLLWASLFYQGGGEWTNEDYTQATFNSEAGVEAAEYLAGLVEQGLHPKNTDPDAEVSGFEGGKSGMAITGIWQTIRFADALKEDFGAGPIPQIFGEGVWAGSHTLAVRNGLEGDERQCAYYFIDWLTRNSIDWAKGGQVPARTDVRESPEFAEIEHISRIAEQVGAAQFPPPIPGSADLMGGPGGANEAVMAVITGAQEAKPALDAAAEQYSQILQQNKQQYGY